jgi:putative ABC transport system substrate-binding protein
MAIKRRDVLAALGGAAASWPWSARAQKPPARIGFLASGAAASINAARQIRTIKQGLSDAGLIESRDYIFEPRFAEGSVDKLAELVGELAKAGVRAIIANSVAAVRAAQQLDPPVPIVMSAIDDPVGNRLVTSLARPGGHTTGLGTASDAFLPLMLELEHVALPKATSVAVLYNPAEPPMSSFVALLRMNANRLRLSVEPVRFASRDELETAFERLAAKPPDIVHLMVNSGTADFMDRIAALALMHRLPALANTPEFATFGGLIGYGPSREQLYLRVGIFVKKILDGANPTDLPVEQPWQAELWINQRTASALGVSLPDSVVAMADKILK